jgi:hypothetical protein
MSKKRKHKSKYWPSTAAAVIALAWLLTDGLAGSSTIDLKPEMLQGYISEIVEILQYHKT